MSALHLEIYTDGGWRSVGSVRPGEVEGSLSHNAPEGRQVYRFYCLGEESVIERSEFGVDAESEDRTLRAITSAAFSEVARLSSERSTEEFWLKTDRMTQPHRFRFRHE